MYSHPRKSTPFHPYFIQHKGVAGRAFSPVEGCTKAMAFHPEYTSGNGAKLCIRIVYIRCSRGKMVKGSFKTKEICCTWVGILNRVFVK